MAQPDHLPGLPAVTDQQRFIDMLDEFGVVWEMAAGGDGPSTTLRTPGVEIQIGSREGPKNEGYTGFYASFVFDLGSGAFLSVGIWE